MESVKINFPNEAYHHDILISVASKWIVSDVRLISDMVFFKVGDITISCRVEEYRKLMLAIQK
jgi:hypothetical protein